MRRHLIWRELRPVECNRQLVDLAGELERDLIVVVVYWRVGICSNVEGLVP
jgi:hypothetical protein